MANVSAVKAKFFEPQGVDDNLVSTTGTAATLVIADGGPYGNLTETITIKSAAGDNRGNTFTITGTDGNGDAGAYVNLTAADVTGVTVYYDG
jgi:hypothetical protein